VREILAPERDVVRRAGVDDPAGGGAGRGTGTWRSAPRLPPQHRHGAPADRAFARREPVPAGGRRERTDYADADPDDAGPNDADPNDIDPNDVDPAGSVPGERSPGAVSLSKGGAGPPGADERRDDVDGMSTPWR